MNRGSRWSLGLVRRAVVLVALYLAALCLQSTVAPHLAIAGAPPDFLLVLVVTLGLLHGPEAGALGGLAGGLAVDLLRGRQLGLFAIGLGAAGALAGLTAERLYPTRVWVRLAVVLAATLVDQLLVVGLYALSRGRPALAGVGLVPAARQAVYNGALSLMVYGPLAQAARRREDLRP